MTQPRPNTDARRWQLAQVRIKPDELRRWHRTCQRIDLTLSQALRRAMREFLREQEQQLLVSEEPD
jgi:hypothetical protein